MRCRTTASELACVEGGVRYRERRGRSDLVLGLLRTVCLDCVWVVRCSGRREASPGFWVVYDLDFAGVFVHNALVELRCVGLDGAGDLYALLAHDEC